MTSTSISWCGNQRSNHVYVSLLPVFGCWDGNYWRLEPPMMTNLVYLCIPVSCPSSHVSVSWWPSLIILSSDPTWVALSLASKEEFSVLQSEKCNISEDITLNFFSLTHWLHVISRVRVGGSLDFSKPRDQKYLIIGTKYYAIIRAITVPPYLSLVQCWPTPMNLR